VFELLMLLTPPTPDPGAQRQLAPPLIAADPVTAPPVTAPPPTSNRPPVIQRLLPDRFNAPETSARVGRPIELSLEVTDPEARELAVSALGLPEGARFSEPLRLLQWTPTAAQRGLHLIRFVASDGELEVSRSLRILVTDNRPPEFPNTLHKLSVAQAEERQLAAIDADGDALTYSLQGLPRGAQYDPRGSTLRWTPSEDDLGPHRVRVTASDGESQTTREITLEVSLGPRMLREQREWQSYLLPGAGYAFYAPRSRDSTGSFQGVALEVLIAAWIHRNENRGPSHGRIYLNAEILDSSADGVPVLFSYALGFSLSLERNPQRKFLIPNYGLDLGQIIHDDFGSRFQSTPYLGLHLFSDRNLFVSTRLGYRLVPAELERLGGLHFGASADFSIW
jgi:hypothetical protein